MTFQERLKYFTPLYLVSLLLKIKLIFYQLFFFRKKLTDKHSFKEPFFIVGYGRSGNTLLRSMLVSGGDVSIPPESYVLPRLIKLFKIYNFLPWNELVNIIIGEFEAYPEFHTWGIQLNNAKKNARKLHLKEQTLSSIINEIYKDYSFQKHNKHLRWGDKTPVNLRFIDKLVKVFPNAKYILMNREPKDAIASALKSNIYKDLDQAIDYHNICERKINILKNTLDHKQILEIKYENLVTNPKDTLVVVSDFLGIDFKTKMLEFWKTEVKLGDVEIHKHHKNISEPLNTNSIGKWKLSLNTNQIQEIEKRVKAKH
ncbi:sulfotransferase family protein [Psychroflexus salis]|uniref:Sulfotransferase n=1 Tax=Psychroflexus salis TaxID=1526574 RepID=A0A916ZKN3_9FLAO|nr:sulfotransferase [Psychroflexus salis]GGE02416.1 sulfotransferase [Psychroflexus salis]